MMLLPLRPTLFVAVLLALSACDSGAPGPSTPAALTGTWVPTDAHEKLYVIAPVDDRYPDFSVPGEGGIVVEGAIEDTLRYGAPFIETIGGGIGHTITFYDRPASPSGLGERKVTLVINFRREWAARLAIEDPGGSEKTFSKIVRITQADDLALRGGRIQIARDTLRAADGEEAVIGGTFTYATRPVAAGDTLLLTTTPSLGSSILSCARTYAFPEDGTVLRTIQCGSSSDEARGTIEGDASSGRFVFPEDASRVEVDTRFSVVGDTMTVTVTQAKESPLLFPLRGFQGWYGTAAPPTPLLLAVFRLERLS